MIAAEDDDPVLITQESGRWRARDVSYRSGRWAQLSAHLPAFGLEEFKAGADCPANPYLRAVVRKPRKVFERPMAVGVVSNSYSLVQHAAVGESCLQGVSAAGVDISSLRCEVGLTDLGEWMNLRIYLPQEFRHKVRGRADDFMDLRLECFNSVDGSSRLVVLFGWLRFVCSNGLVIGETVFDLRDVHDQNLTLGPLPNLVCRGLEEARTDLSRLRHWEGAEVKQGSIAPWVDGRLTEAWGVKAACRVFNICVGGYDVELTDPFARGRASEKPIKRSRQVPGSVIPAKTQFDVSQALSWVATERKNPEERIEWQRQIPDLIDSLSR